MYCPSCGTEAPEERSYCNRCGANLRPVANQSAGPPARSVGATWAISMAVAAVTLVGFASIFSLVMALVTRGIKLSEGGMALVSFALLVILAIDWLLIRQLPHLTAKRQAPDEAADTAPKRTLSEKPVAQIPAPREPATSVTEHTTRTFEPVHRDRDLDTRG